MFLSNITVEDWYNHQISNLLQKNNENKRKDKVGNNKYAYRGKINPTNEL